MNGQVSFYTTNDTDVAVDISGYFVPASSGAGLALYPLNPCRVADTRNDTAPLGGPYLSAGQSRDFPILSSNCGLPSSAQAYSFNFAAVPKNGNPLGYLTAWPTSESQPTVSSLNAPTGTVTANAAVVAAGSAGDVSLFASNDTDLVIDTNGYFAPAGTGGLNFYSVPSCRVLDTRAADTQAFSGNLIVNISGYCGVPPTASAVVANASVVPTGPLGTHVGGDGAVASVQTGGFGDCIAAAPAAISQSGCDRILRPVVNELYPLAYKAFHFAASSSRTMRRSRQAYCRISAVD